MQQSIPFFIISNKTVLQLTVFLTHARYYFKAIAEYIRTKEFLVDFT